MTTLPTVPGLMDPRQLPPPIASPTLRSILYRLAELEASHAELLDTLRHVIAEPEPAALYAVDGFTMGPQPSEQLTMVHGGVTYTGEYAALVAVLGPVAVERFGS